MICDIEEQNKIYKSQFKVVKNEKIWKKAIQTAKPDFEVSTPTINDKAVFSFKEIEKMPNKYKKMFKTGKVKAHVRLNRGVYEVRCMISGQVIYGTSKELAIAKKKFIDNLKTINTIYKPKTVLFNDYFEKWLKIAKKPYVKANTFDSYLQTYNHDIKPYFANIRLASLKSLEIQEYLNEILESGRKRVLKAVYQLLKSMLEYAVADDVIIKSPMSKIRLLPYEQQKSTCLTIAEEKILIEKLLNNNTISNQAFVFLLFTGLRRSELSSIEIDNEFIKVVTSKTRVWQDTKFRRVPISPMLNQMLPYIDIDKIKHQAPDTLTSAFKKILPNHHLHELRHTFITRCQEYGISREMVSLWVGHSADSSLTAKVYTHLENNCEIQLQEIKKLSYIL